MAGCNHDVQFDGVSDDYKRRLWIVIAINATMFMIEIYFGGQANSQALKADALDFLADAMTYGLSLAVIGASIRARSNAALFKGWSLILIGSWVLLSTVYRVIFQQTPEPLTMGTVGFLALAANVSSVLILARYKDGDANVRSVWLCSRNDAIGNIAVMIAALGVCGTATVWPDLIVAAVMSTLFLSSAFQIIIQARNERHNGHDYDHTQTHDGHNHAHDS